jgi:hypothetical protein
MEPLLSFIKDKNTFVKLSQVKSKLKNEDLSFTIIDHATGEKIFFKKGEDLSFLDVAELLFLRKSLEDK